MLKCYVYLFLFSFLLPKLFLLYLLQIIKICLSYLSLLLKHKKYLKSSVLFRFKKFPKGSVQPILYQGWDVPASLICFRILVNKSCICIYRLFYQLKSLYLGPLLQEERCWGGLRILWELGAQACVLTQTDRQTDRHFK